MKQPKVYALVSPSREVITLTVSYDLQDAQVGAFEYLYSIKAKSWAEPFWKDWDGFVKERKRRGWHVREFHLCEAKIWPDVEEVK